MIWLCTEGMIVPVANFVACARLGLAFRFGNTLCATWLICWFPFLQIALPLFRNSDLVSAGVVTVLLLLLLPHPAATTTSASVAASIIPRVSVLRIGTS